MGTAFRGHESKFPLQKPKHRVDDQGREDSTTVQQQQVVEQSLNLLPRALKRLQQSCGRGKPWGTAL